MLLFRTLSCPDMQPRGLPLLIVSSCRFPVNSIDNICYTPRQDSVLEATKAENHSKFAMVGSDVQDVRYCLT